MIRAIIFDMDGVLVEAREWHFEALNRALASFGYTIPHEDHLKQYDGLPTRKKLEILSGQTDLSPNLHNRICELKQKYTMELVEEHCQPYLPHQEALIKLKEMGYRLGLASNSVRQSVNVMMRKTGLDKYMEIMLSNEDVAKPKPDPEIYNKAIAYFGFKPDEYLVIEDNPAGYIAALASGAHVMKVSNGTEVTIENILRHIQMLEKQVAS